MDYACFDVDIQNHIGHIRLTRPEKLNSMIREFWNDLPDIVEKLDSAGDVRVIVVSSTGRHFSAGRDLGSFSAFEPGPQDPPIEEGRRREQLRNRVKSLQDSFSCLYNARIPVLAAVQGGCVGGAVDLVSACDLRYCTADAFFVIEEINIGITADVGTFPRLCHLLPDALVRELAFTGRRLGPGEAEALHFVNGVFETHEDLVDHTLKVAGEIAAKSPLAIAGSKRMINFARDHSVADGLDYIATWQSGMYRPHDLRESLNARKEKRPPVYQDLQPVPKKR